MKKLFLRQAASITSQGLWSGFDGIDFSVNYNQTNGSEPDYKTVISPMALRRMSKITRRSMMCALLLSKQNEKEWDGIIVGTGLGNLADTEKFLKELAASNAGPNSPTAFTQSSHNTLSGQIALHLKNHGYNMTHVQRNLAFEYALLDAQLQLTLGMNTILLGSADEHISLLDQVAESLFPNQFLKGALNEGASYFHLESEADSGICVVGVQVLMNTEDLIAELARFAGKYGLDLGATQLISTSPLSDTFPHPYVGASEKVGLYMTSSAFAMHLGCLYLSSESCRNALVINVGMGGELGLILLSHV
jgi:3-oxoacyl-[acyl-carrier-protein] synthase II